MRYNSRGHLSFKAATSKPPQLNIESNQLGSKWGKHMSDYKSMSTHGQYRARIEMIYNSNSTKWTINKAGTEKLGTLGNDLLRVKFDGTFISLYPGAN